jgi:DNA repair exonuclease SbcCD ATPase subunit
MAYSKITRLRVKNFRNIGVVDIDFTKSPIVTLVGENEAGKTSLIKAFSMCALHDSPRDQKDYIRDGTKALAIAIELEDGTNILRYKELNGANIYKVIDPDGKEWETNKITDGLPKKVSDLMGLTVEPETGEYLNVRTYEDRLLFVVTPGSVNYKVMYNALKVEQLTKAIKIGSDEVNKYKTEVSRNDASVRTLGEQLKAVTVHDISPLLSIKNRLEQQLNLLDMAEKIIELQKSLNNIEDKLGAYELINVYKLETVNEVVAVKINNISRLLTKQFQLNTECAKYTGIEALDYIDGSQLDVVNSIIAKINSLNAKNDIALDLQDVANLQCISETSVIHINKIDNLVSRLNAIDNQINVYSTDGADEVSENAIKMFNTANKAINMVEKIQMYNNTISQYNNYIEQVQNYLTQCGVAVETCTKCGESIIFDLDKLQA